MFNEERDYDERGNYIRDYEDMEVPFEELALPRDEDELKRYQNRLTKEIAPAITLIAESKSPILEEAILEDLNDPNDYYNSEEYQLQCIHEMEEYKKKEEVKEYEIYNYVWMHSDGSDDKMRPVLILTNLRKIYVMMITSVKDGGRNKRKYDIEVYPSKTNGLTKDSYLRTDRLCKWYYIRTRLYKGILEPEYYVDLSKMRQKVTEQSFSDPWLFMNWLIQEEVNEKRPSSNGREDDNINREIKTIKEIEKQKTANHFDIVIAFHDILKSLKYKHYIIWDCYTVEDGHKIYHLYVVFVYKGNLYAANFYSTERAYIKKHENKSLNEVLKIEMRSLKDFLIDSGENIKDINSYKLKNKDITYIDNKETRETKKQKDILYEIWRDGID